MTCVLCKRSGSIYNIYTIYGNSNHCVKDDFIEILGENVESYLCVSDCVCNACMSMLKHVAKLKWKLWQIIAHEHDEPISLGKIWKFFATRIVESNKNDDAVSCRTSTPNLLVVSHSRDYSPGLEKKIQFNERKRNMSRASSGMGRSDVSDTSEIVGIMKKRKRKGHKWTHRKQSVYSRAVSEYGYGSLSSRSKDRRQSDTPLSERSYISYYTREKEKFPQRNVNNSTYKGRRTRSMSKEHEREIKDRDQQSHKFYYCMEYDCPLYFEDLDILTHHKIIVHQIIPLYYCDECHQRYTSAEYLKLHKKLHYVGPFWCLLCFMEMKNQEMLQEHLEEHASYSVQCKYCDKSFLSKILREKHHKSAHNDKKETILYKRNIIMHRIDYPKENKPPHEKSTNNTQFKGLVMPIFSAGCDSTDCDVTEENMRKKNMEFITSALLDSSNKTTEVVETETETIVGDNSNITSEVVETETIVDDGSNKTSEVVGTETIVNDGSNETFEVVETETILNDGSNKTSEVVETETIVDDGSKETSGVVETETIVNDGSNETFEVVETETIVDDGSHETSELEEIETETIVDEVS